MARRTITDAATATLERWLDELQGGVLHIGELPLAVEAWLHAGYAMGRESRETEVAELERQANHAYYLAFTPEKDRVAAIEARLARSLDTAPEEVWDQIEEDLREMRNPQTDIAPHMSSEPLLRNGVPDDDDPRRSADQRTPDPGEIHRPADAA